METMPSPTRAMIVSSRRAADELFQVRPHGHPGACEDLDAVLGDRGYVLLVLPRVGAVDDLRIDARLDGVEHVASGQVDRRGRGEVERDARPVRGDQGAYDRRDVAAGEVVRLHVLRLDGQAGLHHRDLAVDDDRGVHAPQPHAHQIEEGDLRAREVGLDPELEELQEDHEDDEDDCQSDDQQDQLQRHLGERIEYEGEIHGRLQIGSRKDQASSSSPLTGDSDRTLTSGPDTEITSTRAPLGIIGPTPTTETRSSSKRAVPEGRRSVTASPVRPTR